MEINFKMPILEVLLTGIYFIYFYNLWGIVDVISFATLGALVLSMICALLTVLIGVFLFSIIVALWLVAYCRSKGYDEQEFLEELKNKRNVK